MREQTDCTGNKGEPTGSGWATVEAGGPRALVLGLGNTILRDDGAGIVCIRRMRDALAASGWPHLGAVEFREAAASGLDLLDVLGAGFAAAVIVDALELEGLAPGELVEVELGRPRGMARAATVHGVDLRTALEFGHRLGVAVPRLVEVYGIRVVDPYTFGEEMTPAVAAGVERAADVLAGRVRDLMQRLLESGGTAGRT